MKCTNLLSLRHNVSATIVMLVYVYTVTTTTTLWYGNQKQLLKSTYWGHVVLKAFLFTGHIHMTKPERTDPPQQVSLRCTTTTACVGLLEAHSSISTDLM